MERQVSGSPWTEQPTGAIKVDVTKILDELRQEREQLEEAILSLERLARGRGRRRGRPPSWMVEAKKRGRPPGSKNKIPAVKSAAQQKVASTAA
jgi:hypothetical protein